MIIFITLTSIINRLLSIKLMY